MDASDPWTLGAVLPSVLDTMLTPKADELVADPFRRGGVKAADEYFERSFVNVFAHIRRDTPPNYPITVFMPSSSPRLRRATSPAPGERSFSRA
jgi:hypothetical protein